MQNQMYEQENEISLVDLFLMIKKYFLFLVIFTLLAGGIAAIYVYNIAPKTYQSDVQIVVTGQHQAVKDFLMSDIVIQETIKSLNLDIDPATVKEGFTITFNTSSRIIDVSLQLDYKNYSRMILNAMMIESLEIIENNPSYASFSGVISYPSSASLEERIAPNYFLVIFIGMILGGIVSLGYVFIKEMMFPKYATKEALEKSLECDCLGLIPLYDERGGQKNA